MKPCFFTPCLFFYFSHSTVEAQVSVLNACKLSAFFCKGEIIQRVLATEEKVVCSNRVEEFFFKKKWTDFLTTRHAKEAMFRRGKQMHLGNTQRLAGGLSLSPNLKE